MKTFWLSFAHPDAGFLGVCIVDVEDGDAADAKAILDAGPYAKTYRSGAEWLMAATKQAHLMGCNPGGEVLSEDVTDWRESRALPPKNRLLSARELARLGFAGSS